MTESPNLRTSIATELARLRDDALYTEKAHFAAASEWGLARTTIGVTTTLAGAASTAAIIAHSFPALAAVFAVTATIGAALQTLLRPGDRTDAALIAGRELGAVRVQLRQAELLQLPTTQDDDLSRLVTVASELATLKAEIDSRSPAVANRHYKKAKNQIES